MQFGLTLPNRGVLFGVTTPEQMLLMAEIADRSDAFQLYGLQNKDHVSASSMLPARR